jgi:PheRS DNA binding domain 3
MIKYITHETLSHGLTPEGAQCVLEGSHEARVWAALPVKGEGRPLTAQELKKAVGDEAAKVGQGRAFRGGWIGKDGEGFVKLVRTSLDNGIRWDGSDLFVDEIGACNRRYHPIRPARGRFNWNIESGGENAC